MDKLVYMDKEQQSKLLIFDEEGSTDILQKEYLLSDATSKLFLQEVSKKEVSKEKNNLMSQWFEDDICAVNGIKARIRDNKT